MGDKDSVLEAVVHLSRVYPTATVLRFASSELPRAARACPMVVLGGPVGEGDLGGNRITRDLLTHFALPITFTPDCDVCTINETDYSSRYDGEHLTLDWGIIARLPNPWLPSARILVIFGNHVAGVLGAVRTLTLSPYAEENHAAVAAQFGVDPLFFLPVAVPVVAGSPAPRMLDSLELFELYGEIEATFGCEVTQTMAGHGHFETVATVARFIADTKM
jgi:hypothetical protein